MKTKKIPKSIRVSMGEALFERLKKEEEETTLKMSQIGRLALIDYFLKKDSKTEKNGNIEN